MHLGVARLRSACAVPSVLISLSHTCVLVLRQDDKREQREHELRMEQARSAAQAELLKAVMGSKQQPPAAQSASAAPEQPSPGTRIEKLKSLLNRGLISEEEFNSKKVSILAEC
uniref:SHOCT domain-containing protein n=1 Tax=Haptolina ericina TaxID=156174 RepID=A0A7S3B9X7_9EUKA|mmetsp:Transcript_5445/g.11756  ORF Transcript_5445/g.11756 Transcript_5445/m.11756 type:complete len:114 (+) Transcript_5445:193-534(+)